MYKVVYQPLAEEGGFVPGVGRAEERLEAAGAGHPGVPAADGKTGDEFEEAPALAEVAGPATGAEVGVGLPGKYVRSVGAAKVEEI